MVFVEDLRRENFAVFEHAAQNTLESAKKSAVLHADGYLNSRQESATHGQLETLLIATLRGHLTSRGQWPETRAA
jgi:hypothetical protein